MIDKPGAGEFRDRKAIGWLRDAGSATERSTRSLRRSGREAASLAWWRHAVPFALMAAQYVLGQRWPEIFQTFWAYLALVGVFAWYAWKHLGAPRVGAQVRDRLRRAEGLEDAAAMRADLEAKWRTDEDTP